jgi:hypothetical protein
MATKSALTLIEGNIYTVTNWSDDKPRKKMQVTIRKVGSDYVTAETKTSFHNGYRSQTHIGLSTWSMSLVNEWTWTEVA